MMHMFGGNRVGVFFTLVVIFVVVNISHAQSPKIPQLPTIVPVSPEASALAKYINYPVSYGTGLIDISIPLYEIEVGDLMLPIGLSYHASGIKVNENSGLVGLGWTLNAEPKVSRSVEGLPDEEGYLKHVNNPPQTPLDEMFYNERLAVGGSGVDEQPDAFFYTLLSGAGKFFISKKLRSTELPKFQTVPYAPILIDNANIVSISSNTATAISSFNIRDQHGVAYNFANVEKNFLPGFPEPTLNTCWKATTITSSVTGQSLSFQYQTGSRELIQNLADVVQLHDSTTDTGASAPQSYMGCINFANTPIPRATECINGNCNYKFWNPTTSQWVTVSGSGNDCVAPMLGGGSDSEISTVRLKEISYTGGKVVFEIGNIPKHGDCLTGIKIYSNTVLVKQYVFSYETSGANFSRDRIFLTSIDMQDGGGISVGKYRFAYNEGGLPDYLSKALDYWGYYNGQNNDYYKSLIPPITVPTFNEPLNHRAIVPIGNANRTPNFSSAQVSTLRLIEYPTGGSTAFTYQLNQYKVNGQLKNAGGLRIGKVVHNSTAGTIERTYTYGIAEDGAGIIRSSPVEKESFTAEQVDVFYNSTQNPQTYRLVSRKRTFYSNALTDLFYSSGAPVVYDYVTEYESNGSNSIGKTVYQYKYEAGGGYGEHYRVPKTTIVMDFQTDWTYGQLLSKRVYRGDKSTGIYRLISRNAYTYNRENSSESIYVGKTYWSKNTYGYPNKDYFWQTNILPGSVLYIPYTKQAGAMVLRSDTAVTYYGGRKMVSATSYTYDNKIVLSATQVKTTTSDGREIITSTKYPHDLTLTGTAETGRQKLITDWRVSTVLEETQAKGSSVSKSRTDYNVFNSRAQPAAIVTNTGPAMADEPRIVFEGYDLNGNLLSAFKANDSKVYYIWGYGKVHPVAKIEGVLQTGVSATTVTNIGNRQFSQTSDYTSVKADVDFLKVQLSSIISDNLYKVTLYTYFHGSLSSETDASGVTTYYEYDSFGRFKLARDNDGNILKNYQYNYKTGAGNN
jgi:YD repeat-containing protein